MKKVAVIGHFGLGLELLNGQTIKTKIVTDTLSKDYSIMKVDTHGGIKAIPRIIIECIKALVCCETIIVMLTERGLKICIPILTLFNIYFRRSLQYVVIGGWLPQFLEKNRNIKNKLKKFDYIYVETNSMQENIRKLGLLNGIVMPNAKNLEILHENDIKYSRKQPFKICTFSRVMREKGIEEIIEAVKQINLRYNEIVFELDIYGQVDSNQKDWFIELQKNFPDYIRYNGAINYNNSTQILKDYYALIFPTFYEGEGLAGTIIDAYASGLPVIASDWKYNCEVVKNNITGILFKTHDIEELIEKLDYIAKYPEKWNKLKKNCIHEAKKYLPENAFSILKARI